ncbi:MAG: TIGR00296 family protein [Candidatus Methanomethylicia archaeon]
MASNSLSLEDGLMLVRLARRAVEEYLVRGVQIKPQEDMPEKFKVKRGVFVTINKLKFEGGFRSKSLRGCIGYPYPTYPLVEALIDAAISAASADPRFKPLKPSELREVVFEVSVLTEPELIRVESPTLYPRMVRVGLDGLIVKKGWFSGLLLPQVAVEWNWDSEEFLSNCCIKAGLPPDSWLDSDTQIYRFQAEIFEELEPNGNVVKKELHWS